MVTRRARVLFVVGVFGAVGVVAAMVSGAWPGVAPGLVLRATETESTEVGQRILFRGEQFDVQDEGRALMRTDSSGATVESLAFDDRRISTVAADDDVGLLVTAVAAGVPAVVAWSADGSTWTRAPILSDESLQAHRGIVTDTTMLVLAETDVTAMLPRAEPRLWRVEGGDRLEQVRFTGPDGPDPATARTIPRSAGVVALESSGELWVTTDGVTWARSVLGPYEPPTQIDANERGVFAIATLASGADQSASSALIRAEVPEGPWQPVAVERSGRGIFTGIASNDLAVVALSSTIVPSRDEFGPSVYEYSLHYSSDGRGWRVLGPAELPFLRLVVPMESARSGVGVRVLDDDRFLLTIRQGDAITGSWILSAEPE